MMGNSKTKPGIPQGSSVRHSQAGFTIVETLIVLAVTGVLFLSALSLVSGRQNKTEFSQAINNVKNQLDQTINEVSSGYYPNGANFDCSSSGGKISFTATAPGAGNEQGGNTGCIFLGKVIHFYDTSAIDPQPFYVYTLAGSQTDSSGNITTSVVQSNPKVVPNFETNVLQFGLTVSYVKSGGTNIGSFGLVSSLGTYAVNGTDLVSGAGQISLLPVRGASGLTNDKNAELLQIQNYLDPAKGYVTTSTTDASLENPSAGVTICLNGGSTKQSGLITLGGGDNRVLGTTLTIFDHRDCT